MRSPSLSVNALLTQVVSIDRYWYFEFGARPSMSAISYTVRYIYLPAASQVIKIFFLALRRERKYKKSFIYPESWFRPWVMHTCPYPRFLEPRYALCIRTRIFLTLFRRPSYLYMSDAFTSMGRHDKRPNPLRSTRVNRLIEWIFIDKTRLLIGNHLVSSFEMF